MQIKLTEGQTETFTLLHANICNALMYAEDLLSQKRIHFSDTIPPIVTKLRWLKTAIELKIPADRRPIARGIDTLRYDEMHRLMTHMNKQQLEALESYANSLFD